MEWNEWQPLPDVATASKQQLIDRKRILAHSWMENPEDLAELTAINRRQEDEEYAKLEAEYEAGTITPEDYEYMQVIGDLIALRWCPLEPPSVRAERKRKADEIINKILARG